jgi:predicted nucleic acid-binding protein
LTDYFLDSSALAKLYHDESGTQRVEAIALTPGNRISIARLATIELPSSFAIRVRSHLLTRAAGFISLQVFQRDLISNRFHVGPVSEGDFALAAALIERYGLEHRLRSLDALQLASAIKLKRLGRLDYFVAADRVLCEVAALEGLALINPDES